MKIIVDAFGGDNAPLEILKGCAEAVKELDLDILLTAARRRSGVWQRRTTSPWTAWRLRTHRMSSRWRIMRGLF